MPKDNKCTAVLYLDNDQVVSAKYGVAKKIFPIKCIFSKYHDGMHQGITSKESNGTFVEKRVRWWSIKEARKRLPGLYPRR